MNLSPPTLRRASVHGRQGACVLLASALLAIGGVARGENAGRPRKVNQVTVQALADREGITPGGTVELAVWLKMDKGWHVYWRNPGGTGLPTDIQWTAPPGYRVDRTRFPVPKAKYDKLLDETSFIHDGEAVFLTTLHAPESAAPGATVALKASVRWLACKQNCIPGNTEVSLSLPVLARGAESSRANAELFEEARDALPTPANKAEHVKLSGAITPARAKPGRKFTAVLTVDIAARHHMQSHKPLQEYLIPAVLFVELTDGLEVGEVVYPKAHERQDKVLGKLSEYEGKVRFKFPVEVDEDADSKPRHIRGVFQHQICNDRGTCFPPRYVSFDIPVPMDGGPAPSRAAAATPVVDPSPQGFRAANPVETGAGALTRLQNWFTARGYAGVLVLALMGGLILNLMPCVLPVISLKILSFVKQADEDRARVFVLGLAYCAGIMVFFLFIAFLFWRSGTGWGELFQQPRVVLGLAALVTAFALSLFGVFALFTPKVINKLGQKVEGEGVASAFFTGILATFLGTACTAPFLSAAVGAASQFPPTQGAGIFLAVGAGMALPFLILAIHPGWLRFVPRPGPWMGSFEVLMGFLLLGTVVWLLNPLRGQLGDYGLLMAMIFLLAVALAVWIKGKAQFGDPLARKAAINGAALLVVVIGWVVPFRFMSSIDALVGRQIDKIELIADGQLYREAMGGRAPDDDAPPQFTHRKLDWNKGIPWRHYRPNEIIRDVKGGYTVFVDFTADWCVNCKVNLKTSIDIPEVAQLMQEYNVVPYEADYTLPVPAIKKALKHFGRAGVPMYLVYSPGDPETPQVLPEILTPGIVIEALKKAGPSRMRDSIAPGAVKTAAASPAPAKTPAAPPATGQP